MKVRGASPIDANATTPVGIRQLAATLSHELRTPLNAIVGSISLLERRFPEGSRDRMHVDRLKRNSRHLVAMLDDVMELLGTGSDHFTVVRAVQPLRVVVDEALADVEVHASDRRVAIVNRVPGVDEGHIMYWGDERRVRQIAVNLLTNAIKFTAPGGRVTISAGTSDTAAGVLVHPGPWAFLRVEDTGRGIPPSHSAIVFEPFQQVQSQDRSRGHGLGLAICRQFARSLGGDITLSSALGVGSTFVLWLPLAAISGADMRAPD